MHTNVKRTEIHSGDDSEESKPHDRHDVLEKGSADTHTGEQTKQKSSYHTTSKHEEPIASLFRKVELHPRCLTPSGLLVLGTSDALLTDEFVLHPLH